MGCVRHTGVYVPSRGSRAEVVQPAPDDIVYLPVSSETQGRGASGC